MKFTSHLNFIPETRKERVQCCWVLDDDSYPISSDFRQIEKDIVNGFTISTPVSDQFRSDGVVTKVQGYEIHSIDVDGNDGLSILTVVHEARKMGVNEPKPILVETLIYRERISQMTQPNIVCINKSNGGEEKETL